VEISYQRANSWIAQLYEQTHASLHTRGGCCYWRPNREWYIGKESFWKEQLLPDKVYLCKDIGAKLTLDAKCTNFRRKQREKISILKW